MMRWLRKVPCVVCVSDGSRRTFVFDPVVVTLSGCRSRGRAKERSGSRVFSQFIFEFHVFQRSYFLVLSDSGLSHRLMDGTGTCYIRATNREYIYTRRAIALPCFACPASVSCTPHAHPTFVTITCAAASSSSGSRHSPPCRVRSSRAAAPPSRRRSSSAPRTSTSRAA